MITRWDQFWILMFLKSIKETFGKIQVLKKQVIILEGTYHKFNSIEELYASFKQQVPILFVMTNDGKYYSIIKKEVIQKFGECQ